MGSVSPTPCLWLSPSEHLSHLLREALLDHPRLPLLHHGSACLDRHTYHSFMNCWFTNAILFIRRNKRLERDLLGCSKSLQASPGLCRCRRGHCPARVWATGRAPMPLPPGWEGGCRLQGREPRELQVEGCQGQVMPRSASSLGRVRPGPWDHTAPVCWPGSCASMSLVGHWEPRSLLPLLV